MLPRSTFLAHCVALRLRVARHRSQRRAMHPRSMSLARCGKMRLRHPRRVRRPRLHPRRKKRPRSMSRVRCDLPRALQFLPGLRRRTHRRSMSQELCAARRGDLRLLKLAVRPVGSLSRVTSALKHPWRRPRRRRSRRPPRNRRRRNGCPGLSAREVAFCVSSNA